MNNSTFSTIKLIVALASFGVAGKLVLDQVYLTSINVIDEQFHIPQGLAYCRLNFTVWDPKITTLPGLYLMSTVILSPLEKCTVYHLRFVNYLASIFNFYLIHKWYSLHQMKTWKNILLSLNVSLLPPMYFFSHLYYTDVLSVTFILLLIIFKKMDKHWLASIFGMISILMRQTNVIWVLMVLGEYLLDIVAKSHRADSKETCSLSNSNDVFKLIKFTSYNLPKIAADISLKTWCNVFSYISVVFSFLVFVVLNGGIVVGDKTAHSASLHVPQLFYFGLFGLAFTWPYFLTEIKPFLFFFERHRAGFLVFGLITVGIVYFNTIMHPYLLADNRHYTFYIWNRFYLKYPTFRVLVIPVYFFGLYCLTRKLTEHTDYLFMVLFAISIFLILCFQKMIEIRYFLPPYVIFRLNMYKVTWAQLITEFVYFIIVNVVTFYIFFTKNIYWTDFEETQRLIW